MDSALMTALTTGITGIKTDVISAVTVIAPIALAILGIMLVWKFGIRFFKNLSK
jgi:hypothetical protein